MRTMSIYIPSNTTIIPVNTLTLSKTLTLPAVSTSPGRIVIIKDTYGTASSQYIQLSTTGIDTVERGSTQSIRLSTSYGSWVFTNDGVTTWFLVDAYKNSLSQQLVATLPPFATPSITVSFVPNTLSSSWVASINAVSYTVSYYYNQVESTTGGTLIQTFTGLTAITHSFTATPNVNYYYYATVTSINVNSSSTTTSAAIYAIVTPSPPTNVVVLFNSNVLSCAWTLAANTKTYTVVFYETLTAVTTGGSVFQTIVGIVLPYYSSALNVYQGRYYYATVQSFNLSGSSSVITSSNNVLGAAIPLPPPSASITILGQTAVVTWTAAVNAVTYTVLFYSVNTAVTTGGTLFETATGISALTQTSTAALLINKYYYATVTSVNSYGQSAATTTATSTAQYGYAPPATTSLTIAVSGMNVVASWASALNTTTYTVIFYQVNSAVTTGGSVFETDTGQAGLTQTSSTPLVNGKYYYATVMGVNPYGNSSVVTSATASAQIANAPQPPTGVSVVYSGSLSSTWSAALNATTYTVVFYRVTTNVTTGGVLTETNTGVAALTKTIVSSPLAGYYYYTTVTSYNTYGNSATITSGNAAQITVAPSLATSVSIILSGYYLVCSWTAAANTTTYTVVFYQNTSATTTGGTLIETDTLQTGPSTTSTTMVLNTYYYYATVTSVNGYASSSAVLSSSSTSQIQIAPTNPSNVTVSLSAVQIIASWTASTYYVTSYTVVFYQVATNVTTGGTVFETNTGVTGTSRLTSTSLVNGQYYYATVTAVNTIPLSSSTITSSTAVLALLYVQNPSISVSNSTGVASLSWTAVLGATSYSYVLYQATGNNYTSGTVNVYATTGSTSVSINTYSAAYYYFTVTATTSGGSTILVASSIVQSTYVGSIQTAVTNPYVITATNVATMSWSAYSGATGYVWTLFQTTNTNFTGIILGSGTTNSSTLTASYTGLTLNNYYYFSVYATTSSTPSAYGTSPLSLYNNGVPTGGTVTLNTFTALTGGSFVITTPSMNATYYTYYISTTTGTGGSIGSATTTTVGSAVSFTLTLTAGTTYYAVIVPTNTFNNGTAFYSTGVATLAAPVGGSITLAAGLTTTSGSVTITAASPATSYTVYISTTTSSAQSVYSFTTTTTGSAVAFTPSPSLTVSTTYYAVLLPVNSYVNGTYSYSAGVAASSNSLYTFTGTLTFTPAGTTGTTGPTLSQCTTAYSSFGSWVTNTAYFNMTTQGYQLWTVPSTTTYTVVCAGAATFYPSNGYGYGAIITTTISLTKGQIIQILVGQMGGQYSTYSSGGGGGSFVASGITPATGVCLIAAGGGGGFYTTSSTGASGQNASLTTSGNSSGDGQLGGTAGNGGSAVDYAQGGSGFIGNGVTPSNFGGGGGSFSFQNGGTGGSSPFGGYGGFGGGGGIWAQQGGGGGGGYSGGGGSGGSGGQSIPSNTYGGGGGSFCSATITSSSTTNTGQGYVSITIAGTPPPVAPVGGSITLAAGLTTTSGSVTITSATNATSYTVYISTTTSSAQSVYSFTTTTTGSAVAFTPSPSLTASTTYYAVLLPVNSYVNGTYSYSTGVATSASGLYSFTGTLTFTPAGATGRNGPTLSQCTTAYSSFGTWVTNTAYFNMTTAGYQRWTVPLTRSYTISVAGAGSVLGSSYTGVIVNFTIALTQGQILNIVVGQLGLGNAASSGGGAGGSGGTFLLNTSTSTLIAVGGGAGGYKSALTGNNGAQGATAAGDTTIIPYGGTGGSGGSCSTDGPGGSGAGYVGNGLACFTGEIASLSYGNGATGGGEGRGGTPSPDTLFDGGFGGGGGAYFNSLWRCGGGGGYSGGGSGGYGGGPPSYPSSGLLSYGGGGGSYIAASATSVTYTTNTGQGYVSIT